MKILSSHCMSFATVLMALSSCGNYSETKTAPFNGQFNSSEPLSFDLVYSTILKPKCTTCHTSYDQYDVVRAQLTEIVSSVESDRMPKRGDLLSQESKSLLRAWLNAGAPASNGQIPTPVETQLRPEWTSLSKLVIQPKCAICHQPGGQAQFLDLTSRAVIYLARNRTFANGKKLLDLDEPENSYLFEVIRDSNEPMPPSWSRIPGLNENEVNTWIEWVRLGLPEGKEP